MKTVTKVLLIFIFLLIGILIGVFISNAYLDKPNIETSANSQKNAINNSTMTQNLSAAERYEEYSSNIQKIIKSNFNNTYKSDNNEIAKASMYGASDVDPNMTGISAIYIDNNSDAYIDLMEGSLLQKLGTTNYKLKSDIIKCGISYEGQDSSFRIWLIDSQGNVWSQLLYIDNSTKTINVDLEKSTSLANIIDIVKINNGESQVLAGIDIDGNLIYEF